MPYADHYCDISGIEAGSKDPVFFGHDGSECTLIEVLGMKRILTSEEACRNFVDFFGEQLGPVLKTSGHLLSVSFEASNTIGPDIERYFQPQARAARQKRLAVDLLHKEMKEVISNRARHFRVLIACWTRPNAVGNADLKDAIADRKKLLADVPAAAGSQSAYPRLEPVDAPHQSFVDLVQSALRGAGLASRVLGPTEEGDRPDLAEIRRGILFHETPDKWRPLAAAERTYPRVKETIDTNYSAFMSPPIASQIMSSGVSGVRLRDDRVNALSAGGRAYALACMTLFPRTIFPFSDLLDTMLRSANAETRMPFRVTIHLEGGEFQAGLKKIFAGFAGLASSSSKNLFENLKEMEKRSMKGQAIFVKSRIVACTWREPGEAPELLDKRRASLVRALTAWGDAQVIDSPPDPMRALAETVSGMTIGCRSVPATFAPIQDLAHMMPFHFSGPIFERGQSVFLGLDGKMIPHEAFSSDQTYWLTLIFATPGSGKSVLMNRLNYEFIAYTPGPRLPYLCVIDVGVSSSGLIKLLEHALPHDRKHEASYVRLVNDHKHAINPFDIGLGRRIPIDRELQFVQRFLMTFVGPEDQKGVYRQLIQKAVNRLYRLHSDLENTSSPKTWEDGLDLRVDQACAQHNIMLTPRTPWHRIADELLAAGDTIAAMRAHRQAMPTMQDLARVLNEHNVIGDFTQEVVTYTRNAITGGIEEYPMFSRPSNLDLGEARVVAIDLNDVVSQGSTRNNALMFMMSRNVFVQKIAGSMDEIQLGDLPANYRTVYSRYWKRHFDDMQETQKRLCMDEYHLTGGDIEIASQVTADARVGRKWGLEIILVSQLLKDFDQMKNMASTVMLLNGENAELRNEAAVVFDFNEAVKQQLQLHVSGPVPGRGANLLARYKLKDDERWIVLTNIIGPVMLWALSTTKEDRLIRDELYRRMNVSSALQLLAQRYPQGTAAEHWKLVAANMMDDGAIASAMADLIIREAMFSAA